MFKKLRNRLILINLGITSIVILAVFTAIYLISTQTAVNRPLEFNKNNSSETASEAMPEDWREIVISTVREEKNNAASALLLTLIFSGFAIEIAVFFISYFLAEEAIKPVKEAYESQKVFIANASHEIKTPLAAISANLEAADIQDNKWIKNVEIETEKLTNLNNELLNLARTDLVSNVKTENVDLKELVLKTLDSFESRIGDKTLTKQIETSGKIKINADDLAQVLSILMDNAIKYSDKNITVKLNNHNLKVSNDGVKIDSEKLPHIFDRFYQVDKSKEGVGLGLSIAKAVADRNHWKLSAESKKMTTFTLEF